MKIYNIFFIETHPQHRCKALLSCLSVKSNYLRSLSSAIIILDLRRVTHQAWSQSCYTSFQCIVVIERLDSFSTLHNCWRLKKIPSKVRRTLISGQICKMHTHNEKKVLRKLNTFLQPRTLRVFANASNLHLD
jgi:hypothetical protein